MRISDWSSDVCSSDLNEAIAGFLQEIGRRKLIMPTYDALVQTEDGLALAKAVFAKAKPGYHPITTGSVQEVIDEAKPAAAAAQPADADEARSEEHTSELQSLMRTSYAVFCLKKKKARHRNDQI